MIDRAEVVRMISLSIVIPVYNSEDCIYEFHRILKHALKSYSYEIIFVDDQSTDSSWNNIVKISKGDDNVKGINLRKNSGQDNAIMAGLRHSRGEYVVIMDDDLQHSPYDIEKLYNACREGDHDICFANFKSINQKLWKNIGSWFNGKIAEILIAKPKNIYLSPFKIIKKEIVDELVLYDGKYPYIDGLILTITDNITQTTLTHHKRYRGKGNYNLIRSIKVFMKLMTSFSVIPLRIASFTGFIIAALGFLIGCIYIFKYFTTDFIPEGWTTLVIINLFLGGSILLSLGIIGEYIGRSYLKLNRKQQYTIKEIVTKEEKECI